MLIPALGYDWGPYSSFAVATLITGLIVGVIFSKAIWEESGLRGVTEVTILCTALMMLILAFGTSTQGDWTAYVKETFQNANPGKTLTSGEWLVEEVQALILMVTMEAALVFVLGFVALYLGSILRRPKKTRE